jgi:hypothetical protein
MRRHIPFHCIALLLGLMLTPVVTSAQPTLQVIVDRADVIAGDRVQARVVVRNFPPIRTHGIRIGYDRTLLQCVSVQNTGYYEGYSTFFFKVIDSVGMAAGADEAILGPGWTHKDGSIIDITFIARTSGRVRLPFTQVSIFDTSLNTIRTITYDSLAVQSALDAPDLLSPAHAIRDVAGQTQLRWSAVDGASRYRVQLFADSAFSHARIVDTVVTGTQCDIQLSQFNTRHFWRVRAENAIASSSWSSAFEFTSAARVLAAPVLTAPLDGATVAGDSPLVFTWDAVDAAILYDLRISTDAAGLQRVYTRDAVTTTQAVVQDAPLQQQVPYYWSVRARAADGESDWATAHRFSLRAAPPAAIQLQAPFDGAVVDPRGVRLQWERNPNAELYFIQVSTAPDFASFAWEGSVSGTEAAPKDLATSTTYHWRVRGMNTAGLGMWSQSRSFTTASQTDAELPVLRDMQLRIDEVAPHPLRGAVVIRYALPTNGSTMLDVYDLRGALIVRLVDAEQAAGTHAIGWSGRTHNGSRVSAGMYRVVLRTAHGMVQRLVVHLGE